MDGRGNQKMKIRATKPMRSKRRAEQSADRKERQKELRTPTLRRSTVLDYSKELPVEEWFSDLLDQAGEALAR